MVFPFQCLGSGRNSITVAQPSPWYLCRAVSRQGTHVLFWVSVSTSAERTTCLHVGGTATWNIFSFGNKLSDKQILRSNPQASACLETSPAFACYRQPWVAGLQWNHRGSAGQPLPGSFTLRHPCFPPHLSWLLVHFGSSKSGNNMVRSSSSQKLNKDKWKTYRSV